MRKFRPVLKPKYPERGSLVFLAPLIINLAMYSATREIRPLIGFLLPGEPPGEYLDATHISHPSSSLETISFIASTGCWRSESMMIVYFDEDSLMPMWFAIKSDILDLLYIFFESG